MKNTEKSSKSVLTMQRILCYFVLIILCFLCLFSFYILVINSTRSHPDIAKGFSLIPGKSFLVNWKNLMSNENLPVLRGVFNSVFISVCCAFLSTYFSSLAAFGIHAYHFKLRNFAFSFILLVMMVPSQVSTLGLVRLMNTWHLMDTYIH